MTKTKVEHCNLNKSLGFTFAETLVVVAIMIILSTILLANTRGTSRNYELERAEQTLRADLRKSQQRAINAEANSCGGGNVPYFGLRIQENQGQPATYILFADCNRNLRFNAGSGDMLLETVTLDNVEVRSTTPSSGGTTYILPVFIPPNPDFVLTRGGAVTNNTDYTIRLCHLQDATLCVNVIGNSVGNVGTP